MIGNKIEPFKFWCQKVLPTVYDDSLSYYEVLNKVTEFLNEVIDQMNTLTENVEDYEENLTGEWTDYKNNLNSEWNTYKNQLTAIWEQYKNYIDNYFDNLDVQEEINHKLDVMASDGTLDALLLPYFNAYKSQIDTVVNTQNQKITVLEGRMDTFASLTEGSTTGDAELIDIRVGGNGITYPSAGDAVRAQYDILADKVEPIDDLPLANIHSNEIADGTNLLPNAVVYEGKYMAAAIGSTVAFNDNANYTTYVIDCKVGTYYFTNDVRFIRGVNGTTVTSSQNNGLSFVTTPNDKKLYLSVSYEYIEGFMVAFNSRPVSTKYRINELYVPLINIESAMLKDGTNVLPISDVLADEYVSGNVGSAVVHTTSSSYTSFKIKAKSGTYFFNKSARFTRRVNSSDLVTGVKDNATNVTCDGSDTYLYVSFANENVNGLKIAYGDSPRDTLYEIDDLYNPVVEKIYGKGYEVHKGNLSHGESFTLTRDNVAKNNVYVFTGKITSFNSLLVGHGKTSFGSSYIVVNATKIVLHNYGSGDVTTEYEHGLTIQNFITVQINVKKYKADITLQTNGGTYTISNADWKGCGNQQGFAESSNSTLTDCVFMHCVSDARKATWLFGDSYVTYDADSRWTYYLNEDGFLDNILLNGFSGESSSQGRTALNDMLNNIGTPKVLIWAYGMNDGSDTDENTPSINWSNAFELVKGYCKAHDVELILATIPTVPSINNEGKNNAVRNSGYRYIDFAKAVGASSSGIWYTNMLSSDNVHPTDLGAIALYHRAIADAPELTYPNP